MFNCTYKWLGTDTVGKYNLERARAIDVDVTVSPLFPRIQKITTTPYETIQTPTLSFSIRLPINENSLPRYRLRNTSRIAEVPSDFKSAETCQVMSR